MASGKRKKMVTSEEIFRRNEEVLIMGKNNQLYRGRIETCERIPLQTRRENSVKFRSNVEQKVDLHIDAFDQSKEKMIDEHLFEYLDWNVQFNEQVFRSISKITSIDFLAQFRIYLTNFVKNYSIIGHRLSVKINHVNVNNKRKRFHWIFTRNIHQ